MLAEGSNALRDQLKEDAQYIVTLDTDDLHIDMGLVQPNCTKNFLRVGICVDSRRKAQRWEVLSIEKSRVWSIHKLS